MKFALLLTFSLLIIFAIITALQACAQHHSP